MRAILDCRRDPKWIHVVVGVEDGGVGDGDAVEVACKITQGLFPGPDGLGVDNPV